VIGLRERPVSLVAVDNAVLGLAGPDVEVCFHTEADWASVTFSGARHRLGLRFSGDAAEAACDAFCAALPDHEFKLPSGSLLADAAVLSAKFDWVGMRTAMLATIELLIIDGDEGRL
jgi:hypothetical protein